MAKEKLKRKFSNSLYISKGEPFIKYTKNPQELFNKV